MSGSHQPSGLFTPAVIVAEAIRDHRAATPDIQADNIAYTGGLITGICGDLALQFAHHADAFSSGTKLGFGAALALGISLIVNGWRRRGGRHPGGAVTAILLPGLGFYLVSRYAPHLLDFWWAQAFAAGVIVANIIRVAICLAGPRSRALDLVTEDIANNEWEW